MNERARYSLRGMHVRRRAAAIPATALVILIASACGDYLDVSDPGVIDAGSISSQGDAATLSLSARQNLATIYGSMIVKSAWFAGEALVASPAADVNEFGRRDIAATNPTLAGIWRGLSATRVVANEAFVVAGRGRVPGLEIHAARAALTSGYSFILMAEHFCEGAVDGGPRLTARMMLDSAIARLTSAGDIARAVRSGAAAAEAAQIVDAAWVGRARAQLQDGNKSEAVAAATQVSASASYQLPYSDDAAQRGRVGNPVWDGTTRLRWLAAAVPFRGLNDPRVPVLAPSTSLRPLDGVTAFWAQAKYAGYASGIRLTSRLEADYIAAEGQGPSAMLTLIQQRRQANGQPAYAGPTTGDTVLAELMDQRARDFFLEGKTLGDFRRNPSATRYTPAPGAAFHKPGYGPIGNQVCYPLPTAETSTNPNFPG